MCKDENSFIYSDTHLITTYNNSVQNCDTVTVTKKETEQHGRRNLWL